VTGSASRSDDKAAARQPPLRLTGVGGSPGVAVGRARILDRREIDVIEYDVTAEQVPEERARLAAAIEESRRQLAELRASLAREALGEHVHILDSHVLMLEDRTLLETADRLIERERINAEWAVRRAFAALRAQFDRIEDEYLRSRGQDLVYIEDRVLRNLMGRPRESLAPVSGPAVVVAHDLAPSEVVSLKRAGVLGIVTETGGPTTHAAIMARSLELPAVVGLEGVLTRVQEGDLVAVDGGTGDVIVHADAPERADFEERRRRHESAERALLEFRDLPCVTADGAPVLVTANIELVDEVRIARDHGALGVGLFRTEFLFIEREEDLPDEPEQFECYRAVAEGMAPHPVTIRTLDLGADKWMMRPGPEAPLDEPNPALGLRGIRLSLRIPALLRTQLRAVLRAGVHGRIRILLPLVSGVEQVRAVREILADVCRELTAEGLPHDPRLPLGTMIEVPSAALLADRLARECDFFSIGTNDLVQYTLAADRGNEQVADLYTPLHPAILELLHRTVQGARPAGIPVAMCGEMAGELRYLPLLVGLGLDELSMSPAAIPRVKRALGGLRRDRCAALVERAIACATAAEVAALLDEAAPGVFSR
jgi:phosphoenolpyruvate-protein phosphotransferase (PTS system enzyme I)